MANRLSTIFLSLCSLTLAVQVAAATLSGTVESEGKALADVVVTATAAAKNLKLPPAKLKSVTLSLDQKSKEFIPHVLPVKTGTAVFFPNSDEIQHHVYSFSPAKRFEIKLYKGTPTKPIVFNQAGVAVLGCNIHDWMLSFVFVTDTPYFAKTDSAGHWSIDLPEGDYQVALWHPNAANPDQLPNENVHIPTQQPLHHVIELKLARQSGKPPATLQLEGYSDGF
ncbi:MAG: methylamine utilization protein [Methylococcaceae bacterium]|nr:methylamine utilization protein [Methylococcaceae bacterium]